MTRPLSDQGKNVPPLMQVDQSGEVRPIFEVTDEMVERGAMGMAEGRDFWDVLDEETRQAYRDDARAALTAALRQEQS